LEESLKRIVSTRRVIAFDSWTQGAHHIERLVPAFREKGLEILLIHIGSWGHDPMRPREENIGNLLVRDVSYYNSMSFRDILLHEKPCAVLFLSTTAFAHRAFNRYCMQLGIPTVHLYHGLVRVQPVELDSDKVYKVNPWRQASLVVSRFGKQVRRIWPTYGKALWLTGASARDWFRFLSDVFAQGVGRSYWGIAAPDSSTTACCVYTEADVPHAVHRYRIPRERVFAVGNPDLIRFGLKQEHIGICLSSDEVRDEIMYIDTALIEAGAVFYNAEDFVQHLHDTAEVLKHQGFRLVVKLHPAHFRTGVPDQLKKLGIELCSNDEFITRLKTSRAAIVEPSSAALIPALLGLPVLLAQYGKLKDQQYGEVLTSYPRARYLRALNDLPALLGDVRKNPSVEIARAWIKVNAGPLPAEDMPKRVADVVAVLASQSRPLLR
jgi:hypothetical protein